MTREGKQGEKRGRGQRREEQKFFPIITRQNKFDELLELREDYFTLTIPCPN
jgi:hypothetical protein